MKLRNVIKELIAYLVAKPIQLLPLKNDIVFESHPDFSDNSKALFDQIISEELNQEYQIFWLVEDKKQWDHIQIKNVDFVSIPQDSLFQILKSEWKSAWLLSRAKYYFFSHRNHSRVASRKKQIYFNLTHGMSLKDVSGIYDAWRDDYVLSSASFLAKLRAQEYNTSPSKIISLGMPRNTLFFNQMSEANEVKQLAESYDKMLIWMPTFRRQKNTGRNDTLAEGHSDLPILENERDFQTLNKELKKRNFILIIKPHPAQDMSFFKANNYSHIKGMTNEDLAEHGIELYELLGQADALITDYSSVYVDYLILNRPIAFTVDDLADFQRNRGFLVENPLDYMPGPKIRNTEDMLYFIKNVFIKDDYAERRQEVSKLFNQYQDGQAAQRIIDFLDL